MATFRELGLDPDLCAKLDSQGIHTPTSIQAEVFPTIRDGRSALGLSKTGTGKTYAYLLPTLTRYRSAENVPGQPSVVVLLPTRELATQVHDSLSLMMGGSYGVVIVGGEPEENQVKAAGQALWLLATPGRLLDLARRRMVDLSKVKVVVFDEADRLLDMGFVDDMRAIVKLLPPGIQMLFFSATLHFGVDEMAYEFGVEFERFGQEEEKVTVEGLVHRVSFVGDQEKFHALANLIHGLDGRGIVFSNYRERAHEICSRLRGLGLSAEGLTAQLGQGQRANIMDQFRSGKVRVLVASDLAARGLDIDDIDFVVNYDLPEDPASYVHRVGRTARAGRKGQALSFVGFEDSFRLERLEKFLGHPIERFAFPVEQLSGRMPRWNEVAPRPQQPASQGHSSHRQQQGPRPQGPRPQPSVQQHKSAAPRSPQHTPKLAVAPRSLWARMVGRLMAWLGFGSAAPKLAYASAGGRAQGSRHSGGQGGSGQRRRGRRGGRGRQHQGHKASGQSSDRGGASASSAPSSSTSPRSGGSPRPPRGGGRR